MLPGVGLQGESAVVGGGPEHDTRPFLGQLGPTLRELDVKANLDANAPKIQVEDRRGRARGCAFLENRVIGRGSDRVILVIDSQNIALAIEHHGGVEALLAPPGEQRANDISAVAAGALGGGAEGGPVQSFGHFEDRFAFHPGGAKSLRQTHQVRRLAQGQVEQSKDVFAVLLRCRKVRLRLAKGGNSRASGHLGSSSILGFRYLSQPLYTKSLPAQLPALIQWG